MKVCMNMWGVVCCAVLSVGVVRSGMAFKCHLDQNEPKSECDVVLTIDRSIPGALQVKTITLNPYKSPCARLRLQHEGRSACRPLEQASTEEIA